MLVSLGVNVGLAAMWLFSRHRPVVGPPGASEGSGKDAAGQRHTSVVVRRQFFTWREVESADYPEYVANLRDIGCPEQTVRDIIIADVNALYARKRATELVTADQQWWRSEPDTNVVQAAAEKSRALDDERKALLARLLGTGWESGDLVNLPRPSRAGILLDGPVLGSLPADTKQAIQDASLRSQDRMQAYLEAQRKEGKNPDPVELARLRLQTRTELQRLLSPPQLEEFLLRYSQDANNLRSELGQLRYFNATPDEFRSIFRATDTLDQQISLLPAGTDPNSLAQRKALEDQRENLIKVTLGAKRYEDYRLLHDPGYRDALAAAQDAGAPEAAHTFYEINAATASEQDRIRADTNLTAQQKSVELKRIELEQLKANTVAAGQELPPEPPPPPPPAAPKKVYTITPGDNLGSVALFYGVPVSQIREANPNVDFNKLRPGDSIFIPKTTITPSPQAQP